MQGRVRPDRVWIGLTRQVLLAQLLLPVVLILLCFAAGLPPVVCLAVGLVSGGPPLSGSPNLVLMLGGNGVMALRSLLMGTALLPLTCLPVLYLLFPNESITIMFRPALILLLVIAGAVGLAWLVHRAAQTRGPGLSVSALDGAGALALALVVVGLMSGLHEPSVRPRDVLLMLLLAIAINGGLQYLGARIAKYCQKNRQDIISIGVTNGNRNIGLYLSALPAVDMEPLLLFIACYQVPMFMTPLIGKLFYHRLE